MLAVIASMAFAETEDKLRIAVINTTQDETLSQESDIAADTFTGTLAKSEAITLVERRELALILQEQKISASDIENSTAKIGTLTGCQYVLMTSLVYETSPILTARLVDVQTTQVVYSDTEIPNTLEQSAMIAASSRMADTLLEVLTGEQAVITSVGEKEVTINRGSIAGVRVGDMYRVYKGTKRITMDLGVIRVNDVHAAFSTAELVKNGGHIEALRKTDKVEAVSESEAASLISRKKFVKKRSEVKKEDDPTARALRRMTDITSECTELLESYMKSRDVILTSCDIANARKDVSMAGDIGDAWIQLGIAVSQRREALAGKINNLFSINIHGFEKNKKNLQELIQRIDGSSENCYKLGSSWLKVAADSGNAKAMDNLGSLYFSGVGVNQDSAKALELFQKSADSGYIEALVDLGYIYFHGNGVTRDYTKAAEYFRQAVDKGHIPEHGHTSAHGALGMMYLYGLGVTRDYSEAARLLTIGAEDHGELLAQYNLGFMYQQGLGVPQDIGRAIELYRKSAAQGGQDAANALKKLGVR